MTFSITLDRKKWILRKQSSLEDVERAIHLVEDNEILIVLFDGILKDYTYVEKEAFYNRAYSGVVWKDPIFVIEYLKDLEEGENQEFVYDKEQLNRSIKKLVCDDFEYIKVFNILKQQYENLSVQGTIYTTTDNVTPLSILWGFSNFDSEDFLEFSGEMEDNKKYFRLW